jgi:hypothetical protein
MTSNEPLYRNFAYIQGQISSLQALILGLAQNIPKESFRDQSLARLEIQRTALLNSTHPEADTQRMAVDHCEEWVRTLTE